MLKYQDCHLRAANLEDKARILRWRNSERVRKNMYTDHIITTAEHERWFQAALESESARYLIFEYLGRPIGFVSFTQIDRTHDRCTWAFYLGEEDVPRGAGSVMEFFALRFAFEGLQIRKLCCEVLSFNASVVKLHERFGFKVEGRFVQHFQRNGEFFDIVCLAKFRNSWDSDKRALRARCFPGLTGDQSQ
ncbi:MAG: UDP-4-amino-4,6-dideoxy-N-acetyl-beta-L-altrosamine N-acetyltransferase [Planctomycetales bacterium]|nr:UDP-4-amino-4,6-dideoxy-N-acetyl-beta-L-altrosamine N-acetyltransferase [Planctomycetales bacterium]